MKRDAVITIRVPRPTRRRLEALARREGRSLSQQVGRLIDAALEPEEGRVSASVRSLAGLLAREPVPDYDDFKSVRTLLTASLLRGGGGGVGPARR
jgi:hypothetical protein